MKAAAERPLSATQRSAVVIFLDREIIDTASDFIGYILSP
jgi:hypothetical protein